MMDEEKTINQSTSVSAATTTGQLVPKGLFDRMVNVVTVDKGVSPKHALQKVTNSIRTRVAAAGKKLGHISQLVSLQNGLKKI